MVIKNTLFVGKVFEWLPTVDSTNRFAADLLSKNTPAEGMVVAAANQTAGRGQIGRKWESEPGKNVCCSVIFYPRFLAARRQFLLNQAISLAVCDTLRSFNLEKVSIKWPNDIYVGGKKICGLLLQNTLQGEFLKTNISGIGLNVNQSVFTKEANNPTSFLLEIGREFALPEIYQALCEKLEQRYLQLKRGDFATLEREYLNALYRLNALHRFFTPAGSEFLGTIRGVTEMGKLKVEMEGEIQTFDLKEIVFDYET